MNKVACAFPGQGVQWPGMAAALQNTQAWDLFAQASEILGYDLGRLCLEGPAERLNNTAAAQPAVFVTCFALWQLNKDAIKPSLLLGHSLGEITALAAAGAFSFEAGVRLVAARGKLMAKAPHGGMAAVLGLEQAKVTELCQEVASQSSDCFVQVANENSPEQIVISGLPAGLKQAAELALAQGAKRVIELNVSGPFHSQLMEPAASQFAAVLADISFSDCSLPVLSNDGTTMLRQGEEIKTNLIKQITSPVRFILSIQKLAELGVNQFVEISPKRVLGPLVRRISPDLQLTLVSEGGM